MDEKDTYGLITPFNAINAVSRKVHGSAGTFDIGLPLAGTPGIECRTGGTTNDYQIVVTFGGLVTFSEARVTQGTGNVSSASLNGNQIFVNLTGVTNAQTIQVTLLAVDDGTATNNVTIPMSVLLGGVNASGNVDSADVGLVQRQNNKPLTSSNFRMDVNVSGNIDSADVGIYPKAEPTMPPVAKGYPLTARTAHRVVVAGMRASGRISFVDKSVCCWGLSPANRISPRFEVPNCRDRQMSRQGDGLKRANDVVGAFRGEEAFVITWAEVPVRAFVVFVAIKSPDAAHHDEATHPVVPKIANVMEAQVRARVGAFESNVIVKHNLRQPGRLCSRRYLYFPGGGSMIAQPAEFPLHVDDAAVVRRKFSFRYLSHKQEKFM